MGKYSIKDLEKISGVKAHTIRIWEKRYSLVQPCRTSTNIRYYNDNELKRLLNISMLSRNGFKISRIAQFTEIEISNSILALSQNLGKSEDVIENLILSMIEFDEDKFDRILSNLIIKLGFENTFIKVLTPFFYKVGVLWQTGAIVPAHEHFVSNLIQQKLILAIDSQKEASDEKPGSFLLFLPEGEMHELTLLFCHYIVRKHGYKAIYLGQTLPITNLDNISNKMGIKYLVTSFTISNNISNTRETLEKLALIAKNCKIFVIGQQIKNINFKLPSNITLISSYSEFIAQLEKL